MPQWFSSIHAALGSILSTTKPHQETNKYLGIVEVAFALQHVSTLLSSHFFFLVGELQEDSLQIEP